MPCSESFIEADIKLSTIGSITVDILTTALTFVFISILIKFPKALPELLWEFLLFLFLFCFSYLWHACGLSNTPKISCYVVQENGTMFYFISVTVPFRCCHRPLHSSSTMMSSFISLNWDYLGIQHGK